jgi:hypothetical protein
VRAVFTPPVTWHDCLALRITLQHTEPPVWRLIHVRAWLSLAELHEVIQLAFGWKNCHLHEFYSGGIRFGSGNEEEPELLVDERAAPLGAVAQVGGELLYHYDFGDDWEHRIVVENVIANSGDVVACAGGERACPPEDCGGPPGYENLCRVLADRSDPEHASMKRWAGPRFNPEQFDLAVVNKRLATLSRRFGRGRR